MSWRAKDFRFSYLTSLYTVFPFMLLRLRKHINNYNEVFQSLRVDKETSKEDVPCEHSPQLTKMAELALAINVTFWAVLPSCGIRLLIQCIKSRVRPSMVSRKPPHSLAPQSQRMQRSGSTRTASSSSRLTINHNPTSRNLRCALWHGNCSETSYVKRSFHLLLNVYFSYSPSRSVANV